MRSKSVAWSTLTNSASQSLRSSSAAGAAEESEWRLQYSMTLERILLVTLGKGIPLSAHSSSTMCLIVCDCSATASSTSNDAPSELRSTIFLADDVDILQKRHQITPENDTLFLSLSKLSPVCTGSGEKTYLPEGIAIAVLYWSWGQGCGFGCDGFLVGMDFQTTRGGIQLVIRTFDGTG